jgi:hypothetical protein
VLETIVCDDYLAEILPISKTEKCNRSVLVVALERNSR